MTRRIASSIAAVAILLSLGLGAASPASAALPVTPAGSTALCFTIPVGSVDLFWCL